MNKINLILEGLSSIKENLLESITGGSDGSTKGKKFKSKQEIVDFVKTQLNVEIVNDPNDKLNQKRNTLYTEIPSDKETPIFSLLTKYGIRYEQHMKNYYWIWVK